MRIVIFDGSFKTTAFIRRLIQGLVKSGHQVYVLGFNEQLTHKIEKVNYIPLGSNQNKLRFFVTSLNYALNQFSLKSVSGLLSLNNFKIKSQNLGIALNKIKPDIIHLQWMTNINLFKQYFKKDKYNFVISQRGFQTNVRPFINQSYYDYLAHWLPKFKGFHSVSRAISSVGDQIYNDPAKIDQVVYTGLNLETFNFQGDLAQNDKLELISVGRPHWKKGYDLALRAMALLRDKALKCQYTIIGGKGDEELLYLVHELDLIEEVKLSGPMPQKEVFSQMQAADLFLLPSLEEGIANVAVEAMALGTPVISTNCGGMEELITHQKEGWIIPVYDVQAIVDQVAQCLKLSDDKLKTIKLAARKKVETQHNEAQMIEDMNCLYQKVLNNK